MATPAITPLGWIVLGSLGLLVWRGLSRRPSAGAARSITLASGPIDLIGDSLAVGLAGPLGAALQGKALRGWGIGGTNAPSWVSKMPDVLAGAPAAVLVSLGTNDAVTAAGNKSFGPAIQKIVDLIRGAKAVPILLEPPPMPFSLAEVRAAMRATGAVVLTPPLGLERSSDGVHLTSKGYKDWANAIAEVVT